MIQFDCACGKRLQTKEEHVGLQMACPACGAVLTVPGDAQAIRPAVSPPPVVPAATPSEYTAGQPHPGPGAVPPPGRRERGPTTTTSGKAIASLILGMLTFCLPILLAIPAIILGILALVEISGSRGRLTGKGLAIAGLITGTLCNLSLILAMWGVSNVRVSAQRVQSQNNLKQIGLAMHSYHDTYKRFPAAAIYSKDGQNRPLLSWRVAILPYIEGQGLFMQFRMNEPWDSPHNIQLLPLMPQVYASPRGEDPLGQTRYLVFTGPKTPFDSPRGRSLGTFQDGASNTILAVEADTTVPWTKPADLEIAEGQPLPRLGGLFGNGFNVVMADGSARFLESRRVSEPTLRLLIDPSDGQEIPLEEND